MKSIIPTLIFLTALMPTIYATPPWTAKANIPTAISESVAFTIGTKAYVGTGRTDAVTLTSVFYEYNPATDTWTAKANFGGGARHAAVGFAIGSKGYICSGGFGNNTDPAELWEYDPSSGLNGTWTQKANLSCTSSCGSGGAITGYLRNHAFGFATTTKGYVGYGVNSSYYTDFWEYDPTSNTWTSKSSLTGVTGLNGSSAFCIGSFGYVVAGTNASNAKQKWFWKFNPNTNIWTQLSNFGGSERLQAAGFSVGTKGYVGTGHTDVNGLVNDFWEYSSNTNLWTQLTNFGGTGRFRAVGFGFPASLAVGGTAKAYLGTGEETGTGNFKNDFWQYDPTQEPALPVEFLAFNATFDPRRRQVNVEWKTATEENNAYFSIERWEQGRGFYDIGQIKANGNSAKPLTYSFIDAEPLAGVAYYRLKQVDIDGSLVYSKKISVTTSDASKIKIFPTITEGSIKIENADGRLENVSVFNLAGQLVLSSKQTQLDLSAFTSGMYVVVVSANGGQSVQKVFRK